MVCSGASFTVKCLAASCTRSALSEVKLLLAFGACKHAKCMNSALTCIRCAQNLRSGSYNRIGLRWFLATEGSESQQSAWVASKVARRILCHVARLRVTGET